MKAPLTLKQRLTGLALFLALVATLLTPAVARYLRASSDQAAKVAVNWNNRTAAQP